MMSVMSVIDIVARSRVVAWSVNTLYVDNII